MCVFVELNGVFFNWLFRVLASFSIVFPWVFLVVLQIFGACLNTFGPF